MRAARRPSPGGCSLRPFHLDPGIAPHLAGESRGPAPMFHAWRDTVRKELWEAYSWVMASYREAAEKLKAGDRMAIFPEGTFPPSSSVMPPISCGRESST